MINLSEFWENPLPREDEQKELEAILRDHSNGDLEFRGTTKNELYSALSSLEERTKVTFDEFKTCIDIAADYCLDGVFTNTGEEQIKYVRRLLNLNDLYQSLEKVYPESERLIYMMMKAILKKK